MNNEGHGVCRVLPRRSPVEVDHGDLMPAKRVPRPRSVDVGEESSGLVTSVSNAVASASNFWICPRRYPILAKPLLDAVGNGGIVDPSTVDEGDDPSTVDDPSTG